MSDEATDARIADLEADNARLRRLLDQHDAPGELRHRLRSTLAMLRAVIRQSAGTREDIVAYVAHLEDRMDTLMRSQKAIDDLGEVDLHRIIAEELHHYEASEGDQVRLSGPDILLRPRATQVMALAMHELAVNAIEHGALLNRNGKVEVAWDTTKTGETPQLSIVWKERSAKRVDTPDRRGFGFEVLQVMLHHELKAQTTMEFETDGLRYTILMDLTERVGHVTERR